MAFVTESLSDGGIAVVPLIILEYIFFSVANRPKFLPQNAKLPPRKISAAKKICERILCRIPEKWQKRGRTFCHFHLKAQIICRIRP
jgi:hypothetical protein